MFLRHGKGRSAEIQIRARRVCHPLTRTTRRHPLSRPAFSSASSGPTHARSRLTRHKIVLTMPSMPYKPRASYSSSQLGTARHVPDASRRPRPLLPSSRPTLLDSQANSYLRFNSSPMSSSCSPGLQKERHDQSALAAEREQSA